VVAKRELGMLYQSKNTRRDEALRLFEEAAKGGDSESAFQLAEMVRQPAVRSLREKSGLLLVSMRGAQDAAK
jgi:TPR repeat protein